MTFSAFFHEAGIFPVPGVKSFSGGLGEGRDSGMSDDFCYVLQISRIVADQTFPVKELPVCAELSPKPFVLPEGVSLRKVDTFVCRSLKTAREMMLDSALLSTDWVKRHKESDEEGKVLEIFLSTDGHYMAKISRVELF